MIYRAQFLEAYSQLEHSLNLAKSIQRPHETQRVATQLAQVALHQNHLENALRIIAEVECVTISYNYATFSLYGVILARLEQIHEARIKLNEGLAAANALLERTGRLFAPKYMRGLCFATLAVLSSQPEQDEFLWKAQRAYDEALENCNAEGVRHDARLLLREVSKMNEPLISEIMKLLI